MTVYRSEAELDIRNYQLPDDVEIPDSLEINVDIEITSTSSRQQPSLDPLMLAIAEGVKEEAMWKLRDLGYTDQFEDEDGGDR
jgi:flagellar motor protein MotB